MHAYVSSTLVRFLRSQGLSLLFTAYNYRYKTHRHLIDTVCIDIPTEVIVTAFDTLIFNGTYGIGIVTLSYRVLTCSNGLTSDRK